MTPKLDPSKLCHLWQFIKMSSAHAMSRKRARSSRSFESNPQDVTVDETNPEAWSIAPDPKRLKRTHRWVQENNRLIDRLDEAASQFHLPLPIKASDTTADDTAATPTNKRKYDQYQEDLMEGIQSDTESDFPFPRVSTPDSVKGFTVYRDPPTTPENRQVPMSISPLATWVYDPAMSDIIYTDQVDHYAISNGSDVQDFDKDDSLPDGYESSAYERDSFIDDSETAEDDAESASEEADTTKWIRKKKPYGIILAPQLDSDEEEYVVTTDDDADGYSADDEDNENIGHRHSSTPEDQRTDGAPMLNEREQKVFLALVCDYGRNWARFLPLFPRLSTTDVSFQQQMIAWTNDSQLEKHYEHLVSGHPEYRLDEIADAAESGAHFFSPTRLSGHWHHFATGSDRLTLSGSPLP